jgi:hypothetical protein
VGRSSLKQTHTPTGRRKNARQDDSHLLAGNGTAKWGKKKKKNRKAKAELS